MIQANATEYATVLRLEIVYPDKTPNNNHNITGGTIEQRRAHGLRIVTFTARDYVLGKLSGWINQRMFAYRMLGDQQSLQKCAQLQLVLSYNKSKGFHTCCQAINMHRHAFESLAPSPKSSHYNYYQNMILAILSYCRDIA